MSTFLDEARIHVTAGAGGNGAMHFRHEKYVPLGGPDGGDGGEGGSVILRVDEGLNTLFDFQRKRRFKGVAGQAGGPNRMHGRSGKDLVIAVPLGTVVRDAESGEILGDLASSDDELAVARGGKGGLGNVHFKTSTNQAPRFAEKGEPGQERELELELKLIADVGIIGFPNAGKSTLLSVISAARPKIADYPFTTLVPNLGVADAGEFYFVVADMPGLIEDAHQGVGLGHEFLKHIERTLVLIHLLDGETSDLMGAYRKIQDELVQYDEALAGRPQVVVVNKIDLPEAREQWLTLKRRLATENREVLGISALTREGVDEVVRRSGQRLVEERRVAAEAKALELPVIKVAPDPDWFDVERHRRTLHVRGETVERLAAMTDLESDEGVRRLHRRLEKMGVLSALQKAGATNGTRVQIGDVEFHWDEATGMSATTEGEADPASNGKPKKKRGSGSRRRSP